tara:strand:- start:351 stop:1151 length:801 start_codon:yes stop_codon:yes gene_type:complete
MEQSGQIRKMRSEIGKPIKYWLPLGDEMVPMNGLIGAELCFNFDGLITCIICERKTKKSFSQGFCYPCMLNAPEASECIIKPELCEGHLGGGRDPKWEEQHHVQPHYVYLALSSAVKVGVTRDTQVPTRWIDQGASQAILLARTPNRYLAGTMEVFLKEYFTDRTNWRKMLKNEVLEDTSLVEVKQGLQDQIDSDFHEYISEDSEVTHLEYPVEVYPDKVKSVGFDKVPEIRGRLQGIKGQYLLLEDNRVLNIRKHTGYHLKLCVN